MSRFLSLMCALTAVVVLSSAAVESLAQTAASSDAAQKGLILGKLSPPLYPPLAKQARITGDVSLVLGVRQDGSVESAVVVSGHPLLKQAALDSAEQSQFDCRGCTRAVTSYRIVYTFELGATRYCTATEGTPENNQLEQLYPQVIQSQNHVTVVDAPIGTCDPAVELGRKVRSAKCLYLWRCGLR